MFSQVCVCLGWRGYHIVVLTTLHLPPLPSSHPPSQDRPWQGTPLTFPLPGQGQLCGAVCLLRSHRRSFLFEEFILFIYPIKWELWKNWNVKFVVWWKILIHACVALLLLKQATRQFLSAQQNQRSGVRTQQHNTQMSMMVTRIEANRFQLSESQFTCAITKC